MVARLSECQCQSQPYEPLHARRGYAMVILLQVSSQVCARAFTLTSPPSRSSQSTGEGDSSPSMCRCGNIARNPHKTLRFLQDGSKWKKRQDPELGVPRIFMQTECVFVVARDCDAQRTSVVRKRWTMLMIQLKDLKIRSGGMLIYRSGTAGQTFRVPASQPTLTHITLKPS